MEQAAPAAAAPGGAPPAEFITITEAARRLNVNKSTVSRQVKKLDVATDGDDRIDFGDYLAKRQGGVNPLMSRRADGIAMGGEGTDANSPILEDAVPAGRAAPRAPSRQGTYNSASAALKVIQAEKAKLELDRERGLLIDKQMVADLLVSAARGLRDALQSMPGRLGAELAALDDPSQVRSILEREIERELKSFEVRFQALAAGESLP